MNLNQLFSTGYRYLAVAFLTGIFATASIYGFLLVFFVLSDSWAAPIELSPSQAQVLAFQPQVAAMQAGIDKQRIDLAVAAATGKAVELQAAEIRLLLARLDLGVTAETRAMAAAGVDMARALAAKEIDIRQTGAAVTEANKLLRKIDGELAAKLITSDQAAQRRIALQGALNSATDAKVQAVQISEQARALAGGGASTSLTSLSTVKQRVELQSLLATLEIQYDAAKATATALTRSVAENERVLAVARTSAYFEALRENRSVAFMPYTNLAHASVGTPVFDCYLEVVLCRRVGEIVGVFEAEEYARHPLFKTDLKGRFVAVKFTRRKSAQSPLVFVGRKPLFL